MAATTDLPRLIDRTFISLRPTFRGPTCSGLTSRRIVCNECGMETRSGRRLLAWLLLSPVGFANAQSVLGGTVRDAATHAPIANAEVLIAELRVSAHSDERGRFRLDEINGGRYRVLVRKLGYDSVEVLVPFTGDDSVSRDFVLRSEGQPLPVVPVRGAAAEPWLTPKLAEFDDRRRGGIGHFLTPVDLEKEQEKRLSDVVQKLPGVLVVHQLGPGRTGASGSAAYVLSSRGANTIENGGVFGLNCPVAVWLDGIPVYRGNDKTSVQKTAFGQVVSVPGQGQEPPFDINQLNTKTIAAIEFYAGPAQIPARFNVTQGTCGALVIWTR